MATILAHIKVNPGREADFEAVIAELYAASHAVEPDIARYEYWRGAEERTYYTLLSFPDHRRFIEHQVSDHHEEASPKFAGLFESFHLEWVDPIAESSPLAPTAHQDPPDGASELTNKYTDRFAAQVADWWLGLR